MRLHASCVAFDGKGVLIRGASGSGKSTLALNLVAFGAMLVADDQVLISCPEGWPVARAPRSLAGVIEARGIGLLQADHCRAARLHLVVDMDVTETDRLPEDRTTVIAGHALPLLHKIESAHFAAALRQYVLGGKALR